MRFRLPAIALLLAACATTPVRAPDAALEPGRLEARLRGHLEALEAIGPRPTCDREATDRALAYLAARLEEAGYEVREEVFESQVSEWTRSPGGTLHMKLSEPRPQRNLVAERRGVEEPDRVLEVVAHYDTVHESPGINDNGTGLAAVLEAARACSKLRLRRTVRFVLVGMEEDGRDGSLSHIDALLARGETIDGALVLDMVGCRRRGPGSQRTPDAYLDADPIEMPPEEGTFLGIVAHERCGKFARTISDGLESGSLPTHRYRRMGRWHPLTLVSDHTAYWQSEIPAVLVTDTGPYRYDHYHQPSDTLDEVDVAFLAGATVAVTRAVLAWAEVVQ
jgi:aminopeptidase YwaD